MDFVTGVYLFEAPLPSYDHTPPPPYTLYTCILYTYSHREGGGGRANQREGYRGATFTKLGRKFQHGALYCISSL